MGVLHKLVYILGKLDPDNERWKQTQLAKLDSAPMREALEAAFEDNNDDYGRKLYLIENGLYGVDIQPIAIQITKLRFFISLVCDQKTNRSKKDNHGIRPLPNLETKFVAANTLIGLPEMDQMELVDPRVYKIEKEIESLYHSHFSIQRRDQKLAVQGKVKALRKEMADMLAQSLMSRKKSEHIAEWDPFDPQSSADFFDPHWMFGRSLSEGFNIVIGNPPFVSFYSRESSLTKENEQLVDRYRAQCEFTKYESGKGRLNLWMFFAELSLKLCKTSGHVALIADVNFTKDLAISIRRYLAENSKFIEFIYDLSEFENVASGQIVFIAGREATSRRASFIAKQSLEDKGCVVPYSAVCAPEYSFVPSKSGDIESKLSKFPTLGDCRSISIVTGVQIGGTELYHGIPVKDHFYKDSWDLKTTYPSIRVKSVTRYSSTTFERGIKFDYDLASEITKNTQKSAIVLQKYAPYLNQKKLVIRQSAPLIIATLAQSNCCGEYSLFSCITDPKAISLTYLLAILNSKLISYFAVRNEIILQKNGTQPQIRKSGLEKLPIVIANRDDQARLGHLV
jgi:hypothetical protein